MKFNITIEIDENGSYVVECTDLPGCLSEGETFKEAIENISEAIVGCLKSRLKVAGEQLTFLSPQTRHILGYFWTNVCRSFQEQVVISILLS
jgi:predicted RNase H-like HicB family nuclease